MSNFTFNNILLLSYYKVMCCLKKYVDVEMVKIAWDR